MDAAAIANLIASHRIRWHSEADIQAAVLEILTRNGIPAEREVILSPTCRIDLMAGRTAVECKIDGGFNEVLRQLFRYAERPEVDAIVLVPTKASHLNMPDMILGKPVAVASLLKGAFC